MAKAKTNNNIESSIINHLMLNTNNETTATTIAQSIGLTSAKDITNRHNALYNKGIIRKLHRDKRVYWSIGEIH